MFWVVGAVLVAGPAAAQPPAPVQRAAAPAPPAPPPPQAAATGGDELISPYGEPGTAPPGATAGAPAAPEAQASKVVVPKRPATTRMMLLGAGLGLFTGLVLV
ncbi:MAG TPA: hypothetical protein VNO33_07010, partial [Kofleriaceae bacterium]|nr:hypothetical protein [Kofleriaceae bacterium]